MGLQTVIEDPRMILLSKILKHLANKPSAKTQCSPVNYLIHHNCQQDK